MRQTPITSGMPKRSCSAIAEPITSARSHAAMAISQSTQSTKFVFGPVVVPAGLGQVAPGDDPQPRRERLQEHRHQVARQDHPEERVGEARAPGDVRRPVAGVHVAHRHQEPRAGEGQQLPPEAPALGHRARCGATPAARAGCGPCATRPSSGRARRESSFEPSGPFGPSSDESGSAPEREAAGLEPGHAVALPAPAHPGVAVDPDPRRGLPGPGSHLPRGELAKGILPARSPSHPSTTSAAAGAVHLLNFNLI